MPHLEQLCGRHTASHGSLLWELHMASAFLHNIKANSQPAEATAGSLGNLTRRR